MSGKLERWESGTGSRDNFTGKNFPIEKSSEAENNLNPRKEKRATQKKESQHQQHPANTISWCLTWLCSGRLQSERAYIDRNTFAFISEFSAEQQSTSDQAHRS
jgi:hypothetical protein